MSRTTVDWCWSIHQSLSAHENHPNNKEIKKIIKHAREMGFEFKKSSRDHCYVSTLSRFQIKDGELTPLPQHCTLFYSSQRPLVDLLHELDHIYQLHAGKNKSQCSDFKAAAIELTLIHDKKNCSDNNTNIVKVPSAITHAFLNQVIKQGNADIPVEIKYHRATPSEKGYKEKENKEKRNKKDSSISIVFSDDYFEPFNATQHHITHAGCKTVVDLKNAFKSLSEEDKNTLLQSRLSRFDNSVMEVAAYTRELGRHKSHPKEFANINTDEIDTSLQYERGSLGSCATSPYDIWNLDNHRELYEIPHKYWISRLESQSCLHNNMFFSKSGVRDLDSEKAEDELNLHTMDIK